MVGWVMFKRIANAPLMFPIVPSAFASIRLAFQFRWNDLNVSSFNDNKDKKSEQFVQQQAKQLPELMAGYLKFETLGLGAKSQSQSRRCTGYFYIFPYLLLPSEQFALVLILDICHLI